MAVELAVIAPLLLALIALILGYGRQAQVSGLLETAARDGARAATQARSHTEARARVAAVVADTLAAAPPSCRTSAEVSVGDPAGFAAGGTVTVRVSCQRSFVDVGLPLPSTVVTRSFTSPLDPYRGVR
jgi:Flp pilus assembly protein TadG